MRRRNVVVALLVVVLAGLIVLPYATGDYYVHLIALVFINVMLAASLRPSLGRTVRSAPPWTRSSGTGSTSPIIRPASVARRSPPQAEMA